MKNKLIHISLVILVLTTFKTQAASNYKDKFYLKLGYSTPTWSTFDLDDSNWEAFESMGYSINRIGGTFKFGTLFFLESVPLPYDIVLGINAEYISFTANTITLTLDDDQDLWGNVHLASNIGPSFSYNPIDALYIDTYFQFNLNWMTSLIWLSDLEGEVEDDDDFYFGFGQLRYAVGLNIRYKYFLTGIEYSFGAHKLHDIDNDEVFFGNMGVGKKTKLPFINYTIGICF